MPCRLSAPFQAMSVLSSKVFEQVQGQYFNETAAERHMTFVARFDGTFLMFI